MQIKALEVPLTVCKVRDVPPEILHSEPCFFARTDEELSLVCKTQLVPPETLARSDGWRALRIVGTLDFSLVGILARLSALLAQAQIGIFAVSTYNTDYILTREADFSRALCVLERAGYEVMR